MEKKKTDWHTLTYSHLTEEEVFVTTQNGFLVIFDLKEENNKKQKFKLHTASIEGLASYHDPENNKIILATCSGDCTVNILEHYTIESNL